MGCGLRRITNKVAEFIAAGASTGQSEARFEALALELFQFQYRTIEPYRKLCQRQTKTPATVQTWRQIPAVPADAFKHFSLFASTAEDIVKSFNSSGTSQGRRRSQSHFSVMGLRLMDQAVRINAAGALFPDGRCTRILVLAPSPDHAPAMIMAHGMAQLIRQFGSHGSRFLIGPDGLDVQAVLSELLHCQEGGIPVTLMGSSFGFVHVFDAMTERNLKLTLASGSRLVDTGGYKGRSREIDRETFVAWVGSMFGLPSERVVNLLGMTELASQIYDDVLARAFGSPMPGAVKENEATPSRMKKPPPWMRTMLVDPLRVPDGDGRFITTPGRVGLLRHLDLANVERPMMIQTEDLGVWRSVVSENGSERTQAPGFEILGRAKGAEPRGCSLSFEEIAHGRSATVRRSKERTR